VSEVYKRNAASGGSANRAKLPLATALSDDTVGGFDEDLKFFLSCLGLRPHLFIITLVPLPAFLNGIQACTSDDDQALDRLIMFIDLAFSSAESLFKVVGSAVELAAKRASCPLVV
jgi:hypothetical protein